MHNLTWRALPAVFGRWNSPDIVPRAAMTDKGYDSKRNRNACRERGIVPIIPFRSTTKNKPKSFLNRLYRGRVRIEQANNCQVRIPRVPQVAANLSIALR